MQEKQYKCERVKKYYIWLDEFPNLMGLIDDYTGGTLKNNHTIDN